MKSFVFLFSFTFTAFVSFTLFAQQTTFQEEKQFSEAELAQMLAPIALYPDSLLTHILISSTYPIEIVEAHRWLTKNENLSSNKLAQSVENFDWDASIKALVPFGQILSRLSEDLTWTQQLGDAFLQDEKKLLESIQTLRKQAELAGNLDKMDNMEVSYDDENIVIAPVEPTVIYVPYYDTRMVYGAWYWSLYPPVHWVPHHSVYVSYHNPYHWHSGIHISFNYFFSAFHWHNRHVVVVNSHQSHHYRGHSQISRGGYAKRWTHQPVHRKGVAYRGKSTSKKYNSNRVRVNKTNKPLYLSQQKETQRRFKQGLAAKSYPSSKTKPYKVKTQHKPIKQSEYKSPIASANAKKFSEQKLYQQNVKVKTVAPKNHKKNYSKSANIRKVEPVREKQKHSNKKQNHHQKPVKQNRSKVKKTRYK